MGLDMYLSLRRSTYLKKGNRTIDLDGFNYNFDDYDSNDFGISNRITIEEQVAYWRKANAIHGWFVDNVQDGKDDCGDYYVGMETLKELHKVCDDILSKLEGVVFTIDEESKKFRIENNMNFEESFTFKKDEMTDIMKKGIFSYNFECEGFEDFCGEVLPSQEGFFFGSTDYDGGYVYDIIKTYLMIENVFKKIEEYGDMCDIYYSSSW